MIIFEGWGHQLREVDLRDYDGAKDIGKRPRALAHLLDSALPIPGTTKRIGIDGIIGLIPGIGDVTTSMLSAYIIYLAIDDGVSRWTVLRMLFNLLVDALIGAIPVVGDFTDIFWKANLRNISLWERATTSGAPGARRDLGFLVLCGLGFAAIVIGGFALSIGMIMLIAKAVQ